MPVKAVIIILSFFVALTGCATPQKVKTIPNYQNVVCQNVLFANDTIDATKVAQKLCCDYVLVTSPKDIVKFSKVNTVYHIKSGINLQGKSLDIPSGCLLYFDGGSFSNGVVNGNNTMIVARDYEIFKHGNRTFRAYSSNSYKYVAENKDALVVGGTWINEKCGAHWTGMTFYDAKQCASLAINNYIKLHKKGIEVQFPANQEYYVYDHIICSGYSVDFNNSIVRSVDFNEVENESIGLPAGAKRETLKSLYGLIEFNGDNLYLKNLTVDGRASFRDEKPSLGKECLLSMGSNNHCQLQNVTLLNAVGCGICTYAISDCVFDALVIKECGEHGLYTHAYKGTLTFNNCSFINCGQDRTLYERRGQSACVKFLGTRDQSHASLKNLKAYFNDCQFESSSKYPVATFYSDIPYAEFYRCRWNGVQGYSIVSPELAEGIGRLIEFRFVECDNPCWKIRSVNTIRRLIRCTNVTNPFADAVELTDCEVNVGYADLENNYSSMFSKQYETPIICNRCRFLKGPGDISIRNTIKNPRPMVFENCEWVFSDSKADTYKGTYFLVLSNSDDSEIDGRSVLFKNCVMSLDKYRLLYCSNTDISFVDCKYVSSYDVLVNGKPENPNRIIVSNMKNRKKKLVARNSILMEK